ncbi:MAG: malto-oligosyltrehalose synthase, partial [Chitinophagaceae bacterium]|nr:malto-oligosyltrehalose synthase [Chitinophagaceae bacterium]
MNATKFNPISTYRIQFHKDFNFKQFEKIIPYLHKLGIKTIYASPIYEASPGSIHGYNGVNPNNINPEIGTLEELIHISKQLKEKGIAWIQDIVPNHMSFDEHNPWIMDVLEKGQSSAYADFFDIDWNHPKYKGKLMVPFPGSELEKQLKKESPKADHYVICDWQETDKHINYRRFFIVNSLICINIQNKDVFDKYHVLTKYLIGNNVFSGLRIDHIDGLADPKKYLEDLRALSGNETYIVVEKILEPGENIPNNWPIEGNSGYDFLGMVNNLLINKSSVHALT